VCLFQITGCARKTDIHTDTETGTDTDTDTDTETQRHRDIET